MTQTPDKGLEHLLARGMCHRRNGEFEAAIGVYRDVLKRCPDNAPAVFFMGEMAGRAGRFTRARELIARAAALAPDNATYHQHLGNVCKRLGDLDTARRHLKIASELVPGSAVVHYDLGIVNQLAGRLETAKRCYQSCLARDSRCAPAWNNLGLVTRALGDPEAAAACFESAIRCRPAFSGAYINLGNIYQASGDPVRAIGYFNKATAVDPESTAGYRGLGDAYLAMDQFAQAIRCYRQATALQSEYVDVWVNLGAAYQGVDDRQQAIQCYQKALSLNPETPEALLNLGLVYKDLGRHTDALRCIRKAADLDPEYENAVNHLVNHLIGQCEWTPALTYGKQLDRLTDRALLAGHKPAENPFLNLVRHMDPARNYQVAKAWSRVLEKQVGWSRCKAMPQIERCPASKIKIGYLSGNFRNHPTADLTKALFSLHDRKRFTISCYAYGKDDDSPQRAHIAAASDYFHDLDAMDDDDSANLIREHSIDILVDLMGFTKGARLGICARRPAPIQVRMLGMAGTTGASFFDYLITDRIVSPASQQPFYSEKFVFMPDTYQVNDYRSLEIQPPVPERRVGNHRRFIFASFCTAYKIERAIFQSWMRILAAVPHSDLWLMPESARVKRNLTSAALQMNIDPDRLIFLEKTDRIQHLQRLSRADLALDTHPVNGAATTSDALWAGVPVLTVKGRHFASRMSESLLRAVNLPRMVAPDMPAYEAMAIELAGDNEKLDAITRELAAQRSDGALFDTAAFVSNLEWAFNVIWQRLIAGQSPELIQVRSDAYRVQDRICAASETG